MKENKISIFWFRRDLRFDDNCAFFHALQKGNTLPIFIFDTQILNQLPDSNDARVSFIFDQLQHIDNELDKYGSAIKVYVGTPIEVYHKICTDYSIDSVYFNEDYEPYGIQRDKEIEEFLISKGVSCIKYQDHIICHPTETLKSDNTPYTVYTPFSKKWKEVADSKKIEFYPSEKLLHNCIKNKKTAICLHDIGFTRSSIYPPSLNLSKPILLNYSKNRDIPSLSATTHLGTALRFGTISIRKILKETEVISNTFVQELIWREFFISILFHFPKAATHNFKKKYDAVVWRNNEKEFDCWKRGETGYPIVDAGMRELNTTGLMHNRVRMITASFLCKHLLIDWKWGEAYFASKLLDFELASNNGNWQWASSTGCDAVPYFRIFNPDLQVKRFDPNFTYIKKWVPEFQELTYTTPIVEHTYARNRALETYKKALQSE